MIYDNNTPDSQQMLNRLVKKGFDNNSEIYFVASSGNRTSAWAVKVKSLSSYNFYNVRPVEIGNPGSLPTEIGQEMVAVNLAESFLEGGNLTAGKIVVMFKVGDKNIFYAPV